MLVKELGMGELGNELKNKVSDKGSLKISLKSSELGGFRTKVS
jgi:hypothetical protein